MNQAIFTILEFPKIPYISSFFNSSYSLLKLVWEFTWLVSFKLFNTPNALAIPTVSFPFNNKSLESKPAWLNKPDTLNVCNLVLKFCIFSFIKSKALLRFNSNSSILPLSLFLDKNILSLYYHYGLRDANIQTNVVCESCGG